VKEFSIVGKLLVEDIENHQEMIIRLFEVLNENGIKFVGETKEVTKNN
jgi:hypothetical protein